MTSSSKTCDYQWPNGAAVHRCAEPVGHDDWHICRDGARRDADLPPSTAAPQPTTPAPPHSARPETAAGLSGADREHVKGSR